MRITLAFAIAAFALGQASSALAQPVAPLPAKKKATKRSPSSLGTPKEDEGEPAAPAHKGKCPTPSEADAALVRALLFSLEPAPTEIRVIAVGDLALLGDARALNPLAQLIFDTNPAVQTAALDAVSHFETPRAEEILSNVVRHPVVAERLKLQAIEALVLQRSPTSRELLERLGSSNAFGYALQSAARKAVQEWGPAPTAR